MAQRVVVSYIDDLDGSEASDTVTFQLDGNHYELDLSSPNARRLRELFAPYLAAARATNATRREAPRADARGAAGTKAHIEAGRDAKHMRHWLADNGYSVKDRGRIAGELAEAYRCDTPANANTSIAPVFKAATRQAV